VLLQVADQLRGFIGGNAAGNADRDLHGYRVQEAGSREPGLAAVSSQLSAVGESASVLTC
jgi:hypothetical protein